MSLLAVISTYLRETTVLHEEIPNSTSHKNAWASCHIRNIVGCTCAMNAGKVFPRRRLQSKQLACDPGMHHGTCVTHVPWCMSGSLTSSDGEKVPGIRGACAPANLRIWQEVLACGTSSRPACSQTSWYGQGQGELHKIILAELTAPWVSCQIRNIAGCACAGIAGNVFPATAG